MSPDPETALHNDLVIMFHSVRLVIITVQEDMKNACLRQSDISITLDRANRPPEGRCSVALREMYTFMRISLASCCLAIGGATIISCNDIE